MALAIDASTPPVVFTATNTTNLTTASFTPPAGSLLVVLYTNASTTAAVSASGVTNTGPTITWDTAAWVSEAASNTCAQLWTGLVGGSTSATTVTVTRGTGLDWGFGVAVITGQTSPYKGATTISTSTSAKPSATIATLSGTNSLILSCVGNFTNGNTPSAVAGQSTTWPVTTGQVLSWADAANGAGWAEYLTGMNLASGASATITDSGTNPGSIRNSMAMGEILGLNTVTHPSSQSASASFTGAMPKRTNKNWISATA